MIFSVLESWLLIIAALFVSIVLALIFTDHFTKD